MNKLGKFIRTFLVLYNIILMVAGVAASATFIWLLISRSFLGKLVGLHMYVGLLYMLLVVSGLVVLISFLGYFGAANKVKWILYLYGVILSMVFLIMFIASILGLLVRDQTSKMIRNSLLYTMNLYSGNSKIRQAWDEIQSYFKCCGVTSYLDWKENIPKSCCRTIKFVLHSFCNVTSSPPTEIYEDGCYSLLANFVSSNLTYICIFGLVAGLLEVLCSAFSFALATIILQDEISGGRDADIDNLPNRKRDAFTES